MAGSERGCCIFTSKNSDADDAVDDANRFDVVVRALFAWVLYNDNDVFVCFEPVLMVAFCVLLSFDWQTGGRSHQGSEGGAATSSPASHGNELRGI